MLPQGRLNTGEAGFIDLCRKRSRVMGLPLAKPEIFASSNDSHQRSWIRHYLQKGFGDGPRDRPYRAALSLNFRCVDYVS